MTSLFRSRLWLAAPLAALALFNITLTAHAQAGSSAGGSASAGSDLSSSQQARMQARRDQFQKDVAALSADAKMTTTQKQARYATLAQAMDRDMMAILTPAQRAEELKRRQINAQFQKEVTALRADKKLTDAQKKARYLALVQAADAQTLSTLTASQRAQALKRRQTQDEAIRLANELQKSQTPTQAKQIHDLGVAMRTQMQAVIADKTLSPDAKTAKIKEMTNQEEGQISALLTPTQRAKFARWRQIVSTPQGQ